MPAVLHFKLTVADDVKCYFNVSSMNYNYL